MWIFLNNSFLSIVQHRKNSDLLLVRGRINGDIEAVFPSAKVIELCNADYRYRAEVSRHEVTLALIQEVQRITYDNFKNSVQDDLRHDAYMRVWSVMHGAQTVA